MEVFSSVANQKSETMAFSTLCHAVLFKLSKNIECREKGKRENLHVSFQSLRGANKRKLGLLKESSLFPAVILPALDLSPT